MSNIIGFHFFYRATYNSFFCIGHICFLFLSLFFYRVHADSFFFASLFFTWFFSPFFRNWTDSFFISFCPFLPWNRIHFSFPFFPFFDRTDLVFLIFSPGFFRPFFSPVLFWIRQIFFASFFKDDGSTYFFCFG